MYCKILFSRNRWSRKYSLLYLRQILILLFYRPAGPQKHMRMDILFLPTKSRCIALNTYKPVKCIVDYALLINAREIGMVLNIQFSHYLLRPLLIMKSVNTLRELIFSGTNFRNFGCFSRNLVPRNIIFPRNLGTK